MISLAEIVNILIMTVAVAFIFRKAFGLQKQATFWKGMALAAALTAPAIILHELGHKSVALAFGLQATFQIPAFWLGLGVVLALVNAPIIFFIPAYISVVGNATPLQGTLISFAGPAVNLLLYCVAWIVLRKPEHGMRSYAFWTFTKKINGFLLLFNMIPIPPFDGFGVLSGLLKMFGF